MQGVKRGLMSNEAGQGTITMPAAAAEAKHPCEQGIISAIGVFLDTHVICTMTGFIVIMAHRWAMEPEAWKAAGTYPKFLLSIGSMTPGGLNELVMILVSVCFCLFAYTCVIGFITFSEISANRISSSRPLSTLSAGWAFLLLLLAYSAILQAMTCPTCGRSPIWGISSSYIAISLCFI